MKVGLYRVTTFLNDQYGYLLNRCIYDVEDTHTDRLKSCHPVYYLDETWLNEGHTKQTIWQDTTIRSKRQAFIEGLSTGLKNPSGKDCRLIILHIGSDSGFVDDCLPVFDGKKSTDYHEEMNSTVFEQWFESMLKNLPQNSLIVMDNASYHSRRTEKIPSTGTRKKDIQ
ncbi:hypothetical protein NQ315_010867 [Exocentrus adspersus]|uniref:Tc1-like transposase DDE domain-containing protein n=1 Tax=Exocentrus adspersus TaxID=1586481 RepID=A0AAV8VBW7_9CUCU|nr:hypothetical protein NQ315_010867 [Exocentrus adspersus]